MSVLRRAAFLTTIADVRQLPAGDLREVAFAGRSNAGKSSAINTIVDHNRLAYVSKTPGRTQLLNFFSVDAGRYLVDLPGYGYAKTPDAVRDNFDVLIAPYLQQRAQLVGLVLIMDSRHPLTTLDQQLIEWFRPTGRPLHVLLSKADKLTRQEQALTLRRVREAVAGFGDGCSVQLFSSLKKTGVEDARTVIEGWLGIEAQEEPATAPPREAKGKPRPKPPRSANAKIPRYKKKAPGKGDNRGPKMP